MSRGFTWNNLDMRGDSLATIAQRIAHARRKSPRYRKSQEALAADIDASRTTVSNWERGLQKPSEENLERLADLLEVTVEWLEFGGTGGHLYVQESGDIAYSPDPDPEGTPAEQLLHFLGVRSGFRRVAGELTNRTLVAVAYTLMVDDNYSIEERRKIDAWRDLIMAEREG